MMTIYFPTIEPEDLPAFRRAMPGEYVLTSYDGCCGWGYYSNEKIAEEQAKGRKVIEIIVRPAEFDRYCRDNGIQKPNLHFLQEFARQKATRKFS